jgi:hypothetical protein
MRKKPDHFEMFEHSRSAAVQATANVFDGLAKAKQLRKRAAAAFEDVRDPAEDQAAAEGGDFLFDMLRLHASYVNEVARLGARYRDFAYRALENMYRVTNPGFASRAAEELVFARNAPGEPNDWLQRLVVRNEIDPTVREATIDVPRVFDPTKSEWLSALSVVHPVLPNSPAPSPKAPRQTFDIVVVFGEPQVVVLKADIERIGQRKYEDYVYVRLKLPSGKARERRIPVRLDGRPFRQPVVAGEKA